MLEAGGVNQLQQLFIFAVGLVDAQYLLFLLLLYLIHTHTPSIIDWYEWQDGHMGFVPQSTRRAQPTKARIAKAIRAFYFLN